MVVLITGANGGLGTAVVKAFLDSGASSVIGVDRSWKKHPTEDGRFQAIEADLLDPAECARIAERVKPVDALIHVVGGFRRRQADRRNRRRRMAQDDGSESEYRHLHVSSRFCRKCCSITAGGSWPSGRESGCGADGELRRLQRLKSRADQRW